MEMSCVCSAIGNARITLHTVKVGRDRERGSAGRPGRALWISGSSLQWEPSRDLLFHLQGTVRKPVQLHLRLCLFAIHDHRHHHHHHHHHSLTCLLLAPSAAPLPPASPPSLSLLEYLLTPRPANWPEVSRQKHPRSLPEPSIPCLRRAWKHRE